MRLYSTVISPAVCAGALLLAAGSAQADIATYQTQAAYLAAVGTTGVDAFDDLGFDPVASPLNRAAGAFTYTAAVAGSGSANGASNNDVDIWLSSAAVSDTLTFGNFGSNVAGAGGFFFGTDLFGFSTPVDHITLTATDSSGATATLVIDAPTLTSFVGFVSTVQLTSLSVAGAGDGWATVNDLHLSVAAVPEPATYGMVLAGLGLLGVAAGRRRGA